MPPNDPNELADAMAIVWAIRNAIGNERVDAWVKRTRRAWEADVTRRAGLEGLTGREAADAAYRFARVQLRLEPVESETWETMRQVWDALAALPPDDDRVEDIHWLVSRFGRGHYRPPWQERGRSSGEDEGQDQHTTATSSADAPRSVPAPISSSPLDRARAMLEEGVRPTDDLLAKLTIEERDELERQFDVKLGWSCGDPSSPSNRNAREWPGQL